MKDSFTYWWLKKSITSLKSGKSETQTLVLVLCFLLFLWFANPIKYLILASYIVLIVVFFIKYKNIYLALVISLLTSSLVQVGKTYPIQLIPEGIYDIELYPYGYLVNLTITSGTVISVIMSFILLRDAIERRISYSLTKLDIFVVLIFLWPLVANLFGSQQPYISFAFDILGLGGLVLYFYIKIYVNDLKKFLTIIANLFSSFIIFESFVALRQFVARSPIGKNIEAASGLARFGEVVDELEFVYRPEGTFDHANSFAMHLTFWMIFTFIEFVRTKRSFYLYILFLGFSILVVTLSRSAWLGYFVSMMTILFIFEKVKKVNVFSYINKNIFYLLIIAPILFSLFVLPRAERSIYSFSEGGGQWRLEQNEAALKTIKLNPVFGVGSNMLVVVAQETLPDSVFAVDAVGIHNWYLSYATSYGIPATLIFTTFILLSLRNIYPNIFNKKLRDNTYIQIAFLGMVISFFIIGLFGSNSGGHYVILFSSLINDENKK